MSTAILEVTVENILQMIRQLPLGERAQLRRLLTDEPVDLAMAKPPLDKRVPCQPMPDRSREWAWIEQHQDEYAGQWVALDGDRLVAASPDRSGISVALKSAETTRPLIHRIPSPEDLPYVGI